MTGTEHTASFPVTVEVRGITEPARFMRLSDALTALLGSLRALPLDAEQRKYFDDLFGPDAVPSIEHRLTTFGQVRALAHVGLTAHVIKLCPADPGVCP
ncbi:hypothetical protein AB0D22_09655 [Kitasatospora sp. NPDC048538]|uniref:hypothetical protein n=1 Tax=Kitasatospora sp. NPDC048538 TaxID=3155633 RepID=UPI0033F232BC